MLSDQIKKLEEDYEKALDRIKWLERDMVLRDNKLKKCMDIIRSAIPIKVYTHKSRRNTTVKFVDGSSQTVTRIKGEKDCIETAIAYCLLKQILPLRDLKKLIEEREEH